MAETTYRWWGAWQARCPKCGTMHNQESIGCRNCDGDLHFVEETTRPYMMPATCRTFLRCARCEMEHSFVLCPEDGCHAAIFSRLVRYIEPERKKEDLTPAEGGCGCIILVALAFLFLHYCHHSTPPAAPAPAPSPTVAATATPAPRTPPSSPVKTNPAKVR